MSGLLSLLRAAGLLLVASCSSGNSDSPMKTPAPTSPNGGNSPLGAFTTLRGGGATGFVAGSATNPIISLQSTSATWWTADAPTSISFENSGPVDGSVWIDGGKRLRVGLGTLDLAAKSFSIEPALQSFIRERNRLGAIAWFPDGMRVALLLDTPPLRVDQKPPPNYDPSKRELVIASLSGTEPPIRRSITVQQTPGIAAGDDRVVVTGKTTQLFNARGEPLDVPFASLPDTVARSSFSDGRFVLVGADGTITILEARSGATLATWGRSGIRDAVARGNTIVAVDIEANVLVGCIANGTVKTVATARAGTVGGFIQLVGDRVVVSADGPDPVRVAILTTPCP